MAELVAKTYSEALFEVALEVDGLDRIAEEFQQVNESFVNNREFFELYRSPQFSTEERKAIINEVFRDGISAELRNFLYILLDKRRSGSVLEIHRAFMKRLDAHRGILEATVKSAEPLSEALKKELAVKLGALTGKDVRLKASVEKDLIGGLYIKVGDQVLDGSMKNRLENIKESLKHIIV
ncbi:MAG: hypothetical protein AVO33_07680 [delta proteobacterium ML8_F1]|nr:MAG: hypothetical protein AVO33_07680 [delta proteobacterium ML8_F1]